MAALSDYITGTITLTTGEVQFTGASTGWLLAGFKEGDTIIDVTGATEFMGVIASITDNTTGTLTKPWEGPTVTTEYRMRFLADGQRVTAQARNLIELLGNGRLTAIASAPETVGVIEMLPGGAARLVPLTDLVSGANYDVQVANMAARAAYDGQTAGFAVLVADTGDGRAAIFSKLSNASGDWSAEAYVTGPAITLDITEVYEVPYGVPPDVTLTPRLGGYGLSFEIPRGMIIEPGATTTLAPDQPAAVTFVPVTGGYRVDFAIPRGPTGDIDGVTPFWVSRLGSDADEAAARAGLGAVGAPNSATDNRIAVFDGDGNLLKDGGKTIAEIQPAGAVRYDIAQTLPSAPQGQARANIGAGTDSWNWIINGDFTVNVRGGVKKPANGVYGYDRWRGHPSGIEQVVEALPAGEYTLAWAGGGSGTFGGITGPSPILATVTSGNASVIVPQTSTRVCLVIGDATDVADPFLPRPALQEERLCEWYYYRYRPSGANDIIALINDVSASFSGGPFRIPKMRVTPAMAVSLAAHFDVLPAPSSITSFGLLSRSRDGAYFDLGISGGSGGTVRRVVANTLSAWIAADAEFY